MEHLKSFELMDALFIRICVGNLDHWNFGVGQKNDVNRNFGVAGAGL